MSIIRPRRSRPEARTDFPASDPRSINNVARRHDGVLKAGFVLNNAALIVSGDITMAEPPLVDKDGRVEKARFPRRRGRTETTKARVIVVTSRAHRKRPSRRVDGAARSAPDFNAIEVMNMALGGPFRAA